MMMTTKTWSWNEIFHFFYFLWWWSKIHFKSKHFFLFDKWSIISFFLHFIYFAFLFSKKNKFFLSLYLLLGFLRMNFFFSFEMCLFKKKLFIKKNNLDIFFSSFFLSICQHFIYPTLNVVTSSLNSWMISIFSFSTLPVYIFVKKKHRLIN